MLEPRILYEDEYLMAIEKPAGVVVNRAESVKDEETIQDWIDENREKQTNKSVFNERSGIVHRLDRETSGVLLIAKNEAVFDRMVQMFKNREIHKKYVALVHGEVENNGILNFKIGRHGKKGKFIVIDSLESRDGIEGKESLTEFKLITKLAFREESLNNFLKTNYERLKTKYDLVKYSLVEIKLHTGRTHQIRVHFSHIHHAVAGDALYGYRKAVKFERLWCPRQFLHAMEVKFNHPVTDKLIVITSQLPLDLKGIMERYLVELRT